MKYDCIHNFIIDFGPNGFKLGFRSIGKLSIHESKIYLSMCWKDNYIYYRVGVLSSKTLSSNALSSKRLSSNGTLVEWNFGRTEHSPNLT